MQKIVEALGLPRDKSVSDFSNCDSYEWVYDESGEDEVEEIKSLDGDETDKPYLLYDNHGSHTCVETQAYMKLYFNPLPMPPYSC